MVWLAVYDDDILEEIIKNKISMCKVTILPQAFYTRKIDDMEVCLGSKRGVFIRKS